MQSLEQSIFLVEAMGRRPAHQQPTYQEIRQGKHSLITSSLKDESKDEKQVFLKSIILFWEDCKHAGLLGNLA